MRVPPRADGTKAKNYTAKSTRASDGMRDGHSRRAAARDEEAEDPRDHRSRDRPRRAKAQAAVAARRRRSRRCQVGDIRHQRVQKPGGKLSPLVVCRRQGLFENVRCFSHSRVVLAGVFNARRSRGDAETSDSTDVPAETRRQFVGVERSAPTRRCRRTDVDLTQHCSVLLITGSLSSRRDRLCRAPTSQLLADASARLLCPTSLSSRPAWTK